MTKMRTVVHNRTKYGLNLSRNASGISMAVSHTIQPGETLSIYLDTGTSYETYWFLSVGASSTRKVMISTDDCQVWKSIDIEERYGPTLTFGWKGIKLRMSSGSRTAWKNASEKIEAVANFPVELEMDLNRIVIYRAQSANLVRFCSVRVQKIREIFSLVSHRQMWRLYQPREFQQLEICMDNLLCALLSAQKLLKGCGQKDWRRAALVLSLPPPDPQKMENYSGSKFALVIRELGWSFDMVLYALGEAGTQHFQWDDERDRYILQGNQPEDGDANDAMELLRGDRNREIRDHQKLVGDLKNGLLKDNFFMSLVDWLWCNSVHVKFATTIENRCRNPNFDINHLDLRLEKRIAKGGFKEVHKGKWLGLAVAIATLKLPDGTSREREDAECEGILKELKKEETFLVTLHHPNVVDFFGCATQQVVNFFGCATQQEQQVAFLVMELMEEDLGHLINENMKLQQSGRSDFGGVFSLSTTLDILMQIVEAMIHSHKHQVMHRDLKPGNCLVSKKDAPEIDVDGRYIVKVTDFGNSKFWASEPGNHTYPSGTSHYMAPEARDSGDYTWTADVYSFGMLCFEVITGFKPLDSPPFKPRSMKENYDRLRRGERPVIPANCPGSLSALMRKCWAADPTDRPTFKAIQRDLWDYRLLLEAQYVP